MEKRDGEADGQTVVTNFSVAVSDGSHSKIEFDT